MSIKEATIAATHAATEAATEAAAYLHCSGLGCTTFAETFTTYGVASWFAPSVASRVAAKEVASEMVYA